jgi:serine/threonine protein kinase
LLSHIRADQAERWRRGDGVRVEHYLTLHPDLVGDDEVLFDLIVSELLHRREIGEKPTLEEYLHRFPQHHDAVHRSWLSRRDVPHERLDSGIPASTVASPTEANTRVRPAPRVPTLPGFEIHAKLGESGMGVVYKARDLRLNQFRAIKFIRAAIADEPARERFSREAKAAARLDHPGVVRIHAMGEHDGELFICMEYLQGGNLHARLRQGLLDVRAAADLLRRLALAVQHAHDHKVLHRDLKPANVLLSADGAPKVADFGLAKLLDEDDGLTRIGDVMGTPSYMAPEQAEGRHDVAERADVWALGAILYECLSGRPPFRGESRSETMELVKKQPPVPPRRLRAEVPAELEAICLKCLEKRPEHRYAAASELAEHLQAWLDGKPVRIRSQRSRRPLVATFALLLLAAVAAGAFFLLPRLPDKPDASLVGVPNDRDPGSQVSRPPVGPPQPDVWIPLLDRKPDILCWPIPGTTSLWKHKADSRELTAYCEELGLLALGETTASRYQLAISLRQTPWDGNIGLFFGYRTEGSGDEQTRSYQTLTLHTSSTNIPGQPMYMAWNTVFHQSNARGGQRNSRQLETAKIPSLTPDKHYLTMTVGPKGLEKVMLDKENLTRLSAAAIEKRGTKPPTPADYKGRFGIYLHGNNGTFGEAHYLFHKDPP